MINNPGSIDNKHVGPETTLPEDTEDADSTPCF